MRVRGQDSVSARMRIKPSLQFRRSPKPRTPGDGHVATSLTSRKSSRPAARSSCPSTRPGLRLCS
jgi:hypothetical protein